MRVVTLFELFIQISRQNQDNKVNKAHAIFQSFSFTFIHYFLACFNLDLQDGHCPKHIEKCNSWTAEEWHKFTFPMAEVLLIDLPDHEYHLIWLTARIVELLFHHRSGLTEQEVKDLDSICWRRLILLEEQIGPKQCVITCHNSIHIAQDILRFSHSDNHWVWKNERSIKR